ncbi:MAG: dihydrodipicolinate synthase family protein [Siphonobacter aquaeclarae]|jgi:dihydrodipicolinate synthase/N-acetylneuraminate lyase|nr:dihydrodipicolinate synthase family protein [Siphonobacter aquaeclarae]
MKEPKPYRGIVVPLVTPLTKTYHLDMPAVVRMHTHLQASEAMPFILGTTGEAASLPVSVKQAYVREAVRLKPRMLYAGISGNCLEESVDFARFCFDEGVDAVAATLPTYYYLSEDQMLRYFEQLAERIPGPLIIYNIPSTTHMSIPLGVIDRLSYHDRIVGTKDSERSEQRLNESLSLWAHRPDFSHLLGWAAKSAYALLHGSDGLIPSTGNVLPSVYRSMLRAVEEGDAERAYLFQKQSDLIGGLYQSGKTLGESLWALKVLMEEYELCGPTVMPPLQALSDREADRLRRALAELLEKEELLEK